nr:DUF4397 domain-containing protein [Myxococcales bacterium]
RLRVAHAAAQLGGQDMLGDGNPGNPALVDLPFKETWPMTAWATRPAGTYTFEFFDFRNPVAWASFPYTLSQGTFTSMVIYGTDEAREVLATDDAVSDVPDEVARIRWTHVAPSLQDQSLVLLDGLRPGVSYADGVPLPYGSSVESDEGTEAIWLWIDLDDDGACSVGELFDGFERRGGDYFHVMITEDTKGELFLLGHTLSGDGPTRRLATSCP